MSSMELYHFHKNKEHDMLWQERGSIVIPKDFKSATYQRYLDFNCAVDGRNYHDQIADVFQYGCIDLDDINELLKRGYQVSFNANEFKRETAMENFRLANCPNLPSRLHCVYLTDEKGVEAWSRKFGNADLTLYRVEAEGNIFKTNEQLIPDEELSYEKVYNKSFKYWIPKFDKAPDYTNEYLVQGKIKILEKIR